MGRKYSEVSGEISMVAYNVKNDGKEGVTIKTVSEFSGNDILPSDAFFLGCGEPNPDSFAYIEALFLHINLVGRPCGVFSPGCKKAAKYLAGLIRDSEAALNPIPLLDPSKDELRAWSQNVIAKSF